MSSLGFSALNLMELSEKLCSNLMTLSDPTFAADNPQIGSVEATDEFFKRKPHKHKFSHVRPAESNKLQTPPPKYKHNFIWISFIKPTQKYIQVHISKSFISQRHV